MSSTGTTTDRSKAFSDGGATTMTGRGPPRKRAISSRAARWPRGRCGGLLQQLVEALQAEGQVGAAAIATTEWTSSTITVSTLARASRALEVSSRNSDSGW